jgi:hypothetical protein
MVKTSNLKLIWNCYTVWYASGFYSATKYDICKQAVYKYFSIFSFDTFHYY